MKLTLEAKRITRTRRRRVEVIACPGSGKTTCIVARCAHLISSGLSPTQILIVSFSNEAVKNLRDRLSSIDGGGDVVVMTSHALALQIISRNLKLAGLESAPLLLSDGEIAKLLGCAIEVTARRLMCEAREASTGKQRSMQPEISWVLSQRDRTALDALSSLFIHAAALSTPLQKVVKSCSQKGFGDHVNVIRAIHREYRQIKRKAGRVDFGDFMRLALRILNTGANLKGIHFEHLLVDEYQDTSPAQGQMFGALAARISNIMVVGDLRQAIFGFAGARPIPLSDLVDGVHALPLTASHRLTQATADFATALFSAAAGRSDKYPAIIGRPGGAKPVLIIAASEQEQANQVVTRIRRLLATGVDPSAIVVLSRITNHLTPIRRRLHSFRIKSDVQGQITDLRHVLRTLRLVKLVECEALDARSVSTALSISASTGAVTKVLQACRKASKCSSLEGRYKSCSTAYMLALGGIRADPELRRCLNDWMPLCRKFESATDMRKAVMKIGAADSIQTSTIHRAKGREWPHVIVIGATDGVLPDYRSTSQSRLAEERNLMFVAATRASETLTLVHAPQVLLRKGKAAQTANKLSRFLNHPRVLDCIAVEGSPAATSKSKRV